MTDVQAVQKFFKRRTRPVTSAQVRAAVPDATRSSVLQALLALTRSGHLVRTGSRRSYFYARAGV